ncbi:MAG TPA: FtsX-like permease family protein [Oligoflexus sp.]|uniref:ABC transporter permease n=1 Tax=Oligoflexus sp. TaxID=1971216 RepID=UPI002D2A5E70|nr:FtsX-like permease family protein [Oligoflexus sp.]HYX34766.1 FtsX-like permease family protein [Oligoflexus sp.]
MLTMLNIAFRNLLQAKRRTLLLGLAVAIVATLFLFLRAVSSSISERMIESATTLSAGHVNVGGFFKIRKKASAPILSERTRIRDIVTKAVPEASGVIDRHRGWGRIISPASSINAGVNGINYNEEGRFFKSLRLAKESEYKKDGTDQTFGSFEDMQKPNTALIFAGQAKKLELRVGDSLTLVTEASGGQDNTVDLRVAAIASDVGFMSNWSIFTQRQVVLDLYRVGPDTTGVVMVYLDEADQATAVMERLRKTFADNGFLVMDHDPNPFFMKFEKVSGEDWLGQKLDLTIWSDEISFVLWITNALDFISAIVITLLAVIIIGGIMNSMWMSVRERTKEIGTVRAIGAQRGFILQMFVFEAIMLGFLASGLGVLFGSIVILAINGMNIPITNDGMRLFMMANTLKFSLHPSQIVSTLILFSVITGLAALYPALKAARLRPVEALMQGK